MRSVRQSRIADQIRAEISHLLLREIKDPRIGIVTITRVNITADLKIARVYFCNMGNMVTDKNAALAGLKSATGFIKRMLGKNLNLRYIPNIEFFYDDSFEYQDRIERLITKTKKEDK